MADTIRKLLTIKQFSDEHRAWSLASLRALVLNASDRLNSRSEKVAGNGLEAAGAIVRVGRRVLLDEQAFFRWIAEQQRTRNRAA